PLLSFPGSPVLHFLFFTVPPPTQFYTLSLHDALPISTCGSTARSRTRCTPFTAARSSSSPTSGSTGCGSATTPPWWRPSRIQYRSEEHTSELQSRGHLVCRLLLEKKKSLPHNESERPS